jgi:hypothetical protein
VSYTSVKHWIRQDYHLTGEQCLDLLERESRRFIAYCYDFFEVVWPRESNIITTTHRRVQDRLDNGTFDFLFTTPVDPQVLTPKELAAEFGAWLASVRRDDHLEETELLLHNEWVTARKKGFAGLKLRPLFQPTVPKISSGS